MTKRHIVSGKTTQAEILEIFGPPDLVTRKNNAEMWTYEKTRYEVESSGSYATIGIAGGQSGRSSSSSVSTMLIVYFNAEDVVVDYRINVSKF